MTTSTPSCGTNVSAASPSGTALRALRQFHRPARQGLPPLIVFPHAGSGASAYRDLSMNLSAYFTVLVVQYPGRQDRRNVAAAADLPTMAREAYTDFVGRADFVGAPVTVLGHSMGGIVAFEFCRIAEADERIRISRLVPSACAAPSRIVDLPEHPKDDEGLIAHLNALSGTGAPVMGNDALMRMTLPVLRADYEAFDTYSAGADARLGAQIRVIGGADDPAIKPHQLHSWTVHGDDVEISVFAGGHFYLDDNVDGLIGVLTEDAAVVGR